MKIVVCCDIAEQHIERIQRVAPGAKIAHVSQQELPTGILDAEILCGHVKTEIDWANVVSVGNLKWIQSSAAGLDHCLSPPVRESDIIVTGANGLFSQAVAEQTMSLLFGLLRRIKVFLLAAQRREFARRPTDDIEGKTVGIVGFGANGQRIAEFLGTMRCEVVATDLIPDAWRAAGGLPAIRSLWPAEELPRLLDCSDVVIATLPLNDRTTKLFDRQAFKLMKPNAYFINVARGGVVDERALISTLQAGGLAGAGLDVTWDEPLPVDSELWNLENVIITPHVGAQSHRRYDLVTELFCNNLGRYLSGQKTD